MEELETFKKIQVKYLIKAREDIIEKIVAREIDESFFRTETLLNNHTRESETNLVSATNELKTLRSVYSIIERKLEELLK